MDDNPQFSRFQAAILESPIPEGDGISEATGGGDTPASRRRSLSRVEDILDLVSATNGTSVLTEEEIRILRSYHSRPAIASRIRQFITAGRYPDRLLALFSDSTSSDLLVPFLLVILHHRKLHEIVQIREKLLTDYRTFIALSVLIRREKLKPDQQEHNTLRTLREELLRGKETLRILVTEIVDKTKGFHRTHQLFLHEQIGTYLKQRVVWQFHLIDSIIFFVNPYLPQGRDRPSPLELLEYRWLKVLEGLEADFDDYVGKLQEMVQTLRGEIRAAARSEREAARGVRRYYAGAANEDERPGHDKTRGATDSGAPRTKIGFHRAVCRS